MYERWTRCTEPSKSAWEIVTTPGTLRLSIKFYPCGVNSPNPDDVRYRYCAYCHEFIEREA